MGMGLGIGVSRSSYDKPPLEITVRCEHDRPTRLPNPDPKNFEIVRSERHGSFLLVEVIYPDCTNYEGRKILLYEGVTLERLMDQGSIDPHFSENPNFASPIARFVPTEEGWDMARQVTG